MLDLSSYFRPLPEVVIQKKYTLDPYKIGDFCQIHIKEFPVWWKADLVIMGCDEDKGSRQLTGSALAPDQIRKELYRLTVPKRDIRVADLGNLGKRERMADYYDNLATVVHEIVKAGKTLIILGGSQDIVYGQYMGYEKITNNCEYVSIDSELDVEDSDFGVNNRTYNHKIFLHSPNYLFGYTNLGYQSYFVPLPEKKRINNLHFHAVRLGELRSNIRESEPYLRNANMVSVDVSCVRSSDAPGTTHPSPAGFSAEEACQLARYAAMSNRVSSISFCEVQPVNDFNGQTTLLTALMIWYFIEGFYNRVVDEPTDTSQLTKYRISIQSGAQDIVFYKNPRNDRWWMEVPYADSIGKENGRTELIPCSEQDVEIARNDEIPEKWWLAHYKLK